MPWEEVIRILLGVIEEAKLAAEIELVLGSDGKSVASLKIKVAARVEGK